MCGIVGYAGGRECVELLLDGLKRLEYRGYDSAGIALIDESMPVVVIAPGDHSREKILSNIQEVRARNGRIITLCTRGDAEIAQHAHAAIELPPAPDFLTPMLSVLPLQLLAYHIAVLNGRNVDQPRNLAKSVTVE
jgi:glutamine---fructose-6-phosphate transaminase (isomerizing)